MAHYNYREQVKADILDYISVTYSKEELNDMDRDELEERLNDDLWIEDGVTGNGSGSYTFNRAQAKEYVEDNMDLCLDACKEFCVGGSEAFEKMCNGDWEYFDVTIRCYLLGECIAAALDELEEEKEAC